MSVITPPTEIRNIIDRTAQYVAEHGTEFENIILEREAGSAKFSFINNANVYHAYYLKKVEDFINGIAKPVDVSVPTTLKLTQDTPKAIQEVFEMKDPPKEFDFIVDAPTINSLELDIIKLTAQYVARNGKTFLTNIMNREQRNYLFDFLKPQHNMFSYFTKLVEQYTKILRPPDGTIKKLEQESTNPSIFLKDCKYRVAWDKNQARIRKREMEIEDREKMAYAQIDWHDFVAVETVDCQPSEVGQFPAFVESEEVGARSIAEDRGEVIAISWTEDRIKAVQQAEAMANGDDDEESDSDDDQNVADSQNREDDSDGESKPDTKDDDMDLDDNMEMSDNEEEIETKTNETGNGNSNKNSEFKPPLPLTTDLNKKISLVTPDQVLIKQYDPNSRSAKPVEEYTLVSPFGDSKKMGPDQANKHIHVSLLTPTWKDDRDRNVRKLTQEDTTYVSGQSIAQNLHGFAKRRTDIFGTEEQSALSSEDISGVTPLSGPIVYNTKGKRGRASGASNKYGVDALPTASVESIRRANEHARLMEEETNINSVDSKASSNMNIGPQAVPINNKLPPNIGVPPPPPMPVNEEEPAEKKLKQ